MGTSYWAEFAPVLAIEDLYKVLPEEVTALVEAVQRRGDEEGTGDYWRDLSAVCGGENHDYVPERVYTAYEKLRDKVHEISGLSLFVQYSDPDEVGDRNPAVRGEFFVLDGAYGKTELCKKFEERYGIEIRQEGWVCYG